MSDPILLGGPLQDAASRVVNGQLQRWSGGQWLPDPAGTKVLLGGPIVDGAVTPSAAALPTIVGSGDPMGPGVRSIVVDSPEWIALVKAQRAGTSGS